MVYPYVLPKLLYSYDALEPYIDKQTMEIHYTKHHQAYIDNLNKALEQYPDLQKKMLVDLLKEIDQVPEAIRTTVRNNGGGHYNHSLFWRYITPCIGQGPLTKVSAALESEYGTFDAFKELFIAKAKSVFGSGWAWLCADKNKKMVIISSANQDAPIMTGYEPILGLDVWEHAYYLKYQNKRPDYIAAWWSLIDWAYVETEFEHKTL